MQGRTEQVSTRRSAGEARTPPQPSLRARSPGRSGDQAATAPFLDRLRDELGAETFERYIGRSAGIVFDESGLRLTVPSRFAADMIDARFGGTIRRVLSACGRPECDTVRFDVTPPRDGDGRCGEETASATVTPRRVATRRRSRANGLTLDSFVVGHCNRLAFETARRIAESNTPDLSCPFFLYGPCGVGKTHLLSAVAGRFTEMNPGARTKLVTAESFTNEYINAVRSNTIAAFHRAYRRIELLCIDDVHYLAKKSGTQKELLHTFDTLDLGGARIVLASDAHPRQIRQFSEALISRFVSGSLVRIESPDRSTARRLILHFASKLGLGIEDDAVRVLAESASPQAPGVAPSARDLLGAVNRVLAYIRLTNPGNTAVVDAPLAMAAVGRGGAREPFSGDDVAIARPVPIDRVVETVCVTLGVTQHDLAGRGRHKGVVLARAMIALLAKRLTKRSYPEIAVAIGRSNHSTVITAHHRIEGQIERGESVAVGLHLDGTPISMLADQIERSLRSAC
ncbi:MAG: AAA family ATPase [Phycisphaerales bacterium]|nr:AAA family ATPase [Phycisphaerales bacterium]